MMPDFSVVTAIEAGRIERQAVLMLQTLRAFGGPLRDVPVLACIGRKGPKLSPYTLKTLKDLNVELVHAEHLNQAPWFNYSNKIAAVRAAEAQCRSDYIAWLDADIFVAGTPDFLSLDPQVDFTARFEFTGPIVKDDDSRYHAFWKAACQLRDVEFDTIPMFDLDLPKTRSKPYFNSGVFAWRRGSGFVEEYSTSFWALLRAGLAPKGIGPWFADQISITLALYKLDLRWQMLGIRDNTMLFKFFLEDEAFLAAAPNAAILHYSKSRDMPNAPRFDAILRQANPDLHAFVTKAEAALEIPGHQSLSARARVGLRKLRQSAFLKSVREV